MARRSRKRRFLVVVILLYVIGTIIARRRGYPLPGTVVVRCRKGHLFETTWIPGVSFKSIRLGWWRLQWCPVGRHLSLVAPVLDSDLTEEERRLAHLAHDVRLP
jgi:hypothetical protein